MSPKVLEVKNLTFSYSIGGRSLDILKRLDFSVDRGDFVAIQGPSGSGKSTLFYILGCLLRPTSGHILLDGMDISQSSPQDLAFIRNQKIGFIFQQFHLLARASVFDNVLLPYLYPSELSNLRNPRVGKERVLSFAKTLGLEKHLTHLPNQLSGGQQQRVAIARALMNDVSLILADEPTGNLDSTTAKQVLALLSDLNQQGKTIVLITHDPAVSKHCRKIYNLKDGRFVDAIDEPMRESQAPLLLKLRPSALLAPTNVPLQESQQWNRSQVGSYLTVIRTNLPLVIENLTRNRVKSILTMLGVIIGIAAVLAMVTLASFTKTQIVESYEALGIHQLIIHGERNWDLKARDQKGIPFFSFDPLHDLKSIKRIFSEIQYLSPVIKNWQNVVTSGGVSISENVRVLAVNSDYLKIVNRSLSLGKNISPFHVERRSPVCLIGVDIVRRLYPNRKPIGQILSVTADNRLSYACRVIGVLAHQNSVNGWLQPDLQILLPYTYFQTITPRWNGQIQELSLQVRSESDIEKTGEKLKKYFGQKYGKSGRFRVDSDSTLIAQMNTFLNLSTLLLTAIAILSLLIGGIGINNMMLVSVSERLKEFGIRKALGATDRSIRIQVLMESTLLCSMAGLLGAGLGFLTYETLIWGASRFVTNVKFEWYFDPIAILLSIFSILAVGIGSGLIPALKAEKLQVIECLRSD